MPHPPPVVTTPVVKEAAVVIPKLVAGEPPSPFTTWCEWATWLLQQALQGLTSVSGGVEGYTIGSRSIRFRSPADQTKAIDLANQLVLEFCGVEVLPQSATGRDTARRIIPSDV
jgi:hypothetical protein